MLNVEVRRDAIEKLNAALAKHEEIRKNALKASELLYKQRVKASHQVIEQVESYVNLLANSPKDFDKSVSEYRVAVDSFDHHVERIESESLQTSKIGSATAGGGAVAGVGVAAMGPTAAMAVATTFGTASTGTAISALSGAAATNAALAWLGGGALAAGGGGMAAGNALLALAGPIGWGIAGTAVAGSAIYMRTRNRKYAEEAKENQIKVEAEIRSIRTALKEIKSLQKSTGTHVNGCLSCLEHLTRKASENYLEFTQDHKERLQFLINHVRSLSKLLNMRASF